VFPPKTLESYLFYMNPKYAGSPDRVLKEEPKPSTEHVCKKHKTYKLVEGVLQSIRLREIRGIGA